MSRAQGSSGVAVRSGLDLRILGPFEVRFDGARVTIPGRKARTLLAALVVAAGNTVSRDRLIDSIWGETPPSSAVNTLHTYVTHLRRAFADAGAGANSSVIGTHPNGYHLAVEESAVDSWRLERGLTESRLLADRHEGAGAVATLEASLGEWRGPPLEEFIDAGFAQAEATRLTDLRFHAEELRVASLLGIGEEGRALQLLEGLVEEFPYRERLWEHLMLALYRSGRQRDALTTYRRLADCLAEIGLEPGEGASELETRILEKDPSLARSEIAAHAVQTHRPIPRPTDSFVGRAAEIDALRKMATESRLITITGIGGIGKSRLAIEFGHRLAADLGSEDRYVDLQAVTSPELVWTSLTESFGVGESAQPVQRIVEAVGRSELVLVIDNAEDAAPPLRSILEDLLGRCPGLRVVVSSREPLDLAAERISPLGPLQTAGGAGASEAATLFAGRARWSEPLDAEAMATVTEICRAVNGIPAAIEVVAASSRVFSLNEIAGRLDMLVHDEDGRQSLPSVLAWSYEALTEDQRHLFRVASMFVGGFTFDALRSVADPSSDPRSQLNDVGALIDRSLISLREGTPSRYQMLDVFGRQGLQWLEEAGERAGAGERFVTYFCDMTTGLEDSFGSDRWLQMLGRVDQDMANCSRALEVALGYDDPTDAYRIAGSLGRYWRWRGRSIEGAARLREVLRRGDAGPLERAKVEREVSGTLRTLGDFHSARTHAERALELYEAAGYAPGRADALYDLALADIFSGNFDGARELLDRSAEIWRHLNEPALSAFPMIPLAWLHTIHGEYETAEAMWISILTNVDTARYPEHSGITFRVAELALAQGQLERAERIAKQALDAACDARYPYHEAGARVVLARIYTEHGDANSAREQATLALSAAQDGGNVEGAARALEILVRLAAWSGDVVGALRGLQRSVLSAGHLGGALTRSMLAELAATIQIARADYADAAALHGAAHAIRAGHNLPLGVLDEAQRVRELTTIEESLGRSEFERNYQKGLGGAEHAVLDHIGAWFE